MVVLTPINLGTIVQVLKIVRGDNSHNIRDIFNYYDKLWMSIVGYLFFIITVGMFGTMILIICAIIIKCTFMNKGAVQYI